MDEDIIAFDLLRGLRVLCGESLLSCDLLAQRRATSERLKTKDLSHHGEYGEAISL